jgi:hypothetical protein
MPTLKGLGAFTGAVYDPPRPSIVGNRHRYRRFVHVKSHVTRDRFHVARLPCMRLCVVFPTA